MGAWILILTLNATGVPSIAVVPGFTTEARCVAAADAWRRSLPERAIGHAACVETGAQL